MTKIKYRGPLRPCVYPSCTKEDREKLERLSWHAFPDPKIDGELRKKWVDAVRKDVGNPYWIPLRMRGHVVCSRHFPEDAFIPGVKGRWLKEDVVPQMKPPDEKDANQNEHTEAFQKDKSENRRTEVGDKFRNTSRKKFVEMYESFQPILKLLYNPENAEFQNGRRVWERAKTICEVCGMLAGNRISCQMLSDDHVAILLESLLLFCPEKESRRVEAAEEEGDVKERKGKELWVCRGCLVSVGMLVSMLGRLDQLKWEINEMRRKLGKIVILSSLKKSQEEFDEWEEKMKSVEDVYPSECMKKLLGESINWSLPSETEKKVEKEDADTGTSRKTLGCSREAEDRTGKTVKCPGNAVEGILRSSLKSVERSGESLVKPLESAVKTVTVESSPNTSQISETIPHSSLEPVVGLVMSVHSYAKTAKPVKPNLVKSEPKPAKSSVQTPKTTVKVYLKTAVVEKSTKAIKCSDMTVQDFTRKDSGQSVRCYGKKAVKNPTVEDPLKTTDKFPEVSSSSDSLSVPNQPLSVNALKLASPSNAVKGPIEIPGNKSTSTTNTEKELTQDSFNVPANSGILGEAKDVQGDTAAPSNSKKRYLVVVRRPKVEELPSKRPRTTVSSGPFKNESAAASNSKTQSLPELSQRVESPQKEYLPCVMNPPLELVKVEESETEIEFANPLELMEDPLQLPSEFEAGEDNHQLLEWTLGDGGASISLRSLPSVYELKMGSSQSLEEVYTLD